MSRICKLFYPVELVCLVFLLITVSLYCILGLSIRDPASLYIGKLSFGVLTYLLGLLLAFFLLRLADIQRTMSDGAIRDRTYSLTRFRRNYLSVSAIASDLRLIHAIALLFVIYINLKHLIPLVNNRVYDPLLYRLEVWLFAGNQPTEFLIELFGRDAAGVMSFGYTLFYPYLAFLTVFVVLQHKNLLTQRFAVAFVLTWFLAVFIEYAFPTWGPCFSTPELISLLPATEVSELQQELWTQKLHLDTNPKSPVGVFLISGVPSLHLATVVLGSIYLQQLNKLAAILSWVFVLITVITTIYFGWHFVADLLAAVFLVFCAQQITDELFQTFWSASVERE